MKLLNQRHAAGVAIKLIKVKSHCGELLNEAADALASAAAEADDSQLPSVLHLEQDSVHPTSTLTVLQLTEALAYVTI